VALRKGGVPMNTVIGIWEAVKTGVGVYCRVQLVNRWNRRQDKKA